MSWRVLGHGHWTEGEPDRMVMRLGACVPRHNVTGAKKMLRALYVRGARTQPPPRVVGMHIPFQPAFPNLQVLPPDMVTLDRIFL